MALPIGLHVRGKTKASILSLLAGALSLGLFCALLDPFLNLWDEQYHALVAKNLANNGLLPLLYPETPLEYDFRDWTSNYVWLHKQPLFLWQMALSIKLFGTSVLAVRLPSVLMHTAVVYFTYRIGSISMNEKVGFIGALFFAVAFFPLEMVAGTFATDHNDVAFLFYVIGSFWCWFEYQTSKNRVWLILIGVFSGCAILVKWLVGLLIYACWGLESIVTRQFVGFLRTIWMPLLATIVIALPWQLYISSVFPQEAAYEYALNTRHFFEAIEGHAGDGFFHLNAARTLYGSGDLVPLLLLVGFLWMLIRIRDLGFKIILGGGVVITYLFYSMAATKMTAFTLIVSPIIFLGFASLAYAFFSWIDNRIPKGSGCIQFIGLFLFAYLFFNPVKVYHNHSDWKPGDNRNRRVEKLQLEAIQRFQREFDSMPQVVIFNADIRMNGHIATMFFTDYLAYPGIPTMEEIDLLNEKGYPVAVVNQGGLPSAIHDRSDIRILDFPVE